MAIRTALRQMCRWAARDEGGFRLRASIGKYSSQALALPICTTNVIRGACGSANVGSGCGRSDNGAAPTTVGTYPEERPDGRVPRQRNHLFHASCCVLGVTAASRLA
ncbi:hypothetical protein FUT69_03770 [Xylella taiwanensis]|uniref:Uncharacterized protein n=1 Tax=Xylella taiwanensis TaxID=1444770 RepID=Z9JNX2_9GAMM|nr:hypothetical protein [Xylella taiwanensis]AXI84478.1 hypothetical protein AB672_11365 [Xylella taiwanensis]EWS79452.1 hypothetical protein AF72_00705 [Xylella taiwanensis]MCD8455376.1 hypothetical protein [Xylella taiwanensis]MCD8457780.1 hypothetical protein [Xylella taiwanensis]MCD8459915.1 hypothetical protein [Xylella taiwanensis]